MQLPSANAGAEPPEVEAGLNRLRFEDITPAQFDPPAGGLDNFGKPDDGKRYRFVFTLLGEDGEPVYQGDDPEPVELDAITRTATGEKSNFAKLLSGIMSKPEFASWQAGGTFDSEAIKGRIVDAKVSHNKKGWPFVEEVIGLAKVKAAAKS